MKYRFILCFLFITASLSAQDFDRAKMDQYLQVLESNDKAMLTLSIRDHGELVYQKSIGFANVKEDIKPNATTQYRIGSVTKVFTSVMIFQLIEEGKLSLDTKLSDYYPGIKNADQITIAQLLSHRSGIFNVTNRIDYRAYMTQEKSKSDMVTIFESLDSDFEPGSSANYSNTAFILLGYIIEDITGKPYAQQLKAKVTEPLGLNRTAYGGTLAASENHARSYRDEGEKWGPSFETHMSIPHGAGAITSTTADLTQFFDALFNGKLVNEASLSKMKEINFNFGHGLMKIPFYGRTAYGHGGNIDAFDTNAAYFEDDKVAVAITANGMNMPFNDMLIGVLSIYYGRSFKIPDYSAKPVTLSQKLLKNYEGNFSSEQMPLKIKIEAKSGKLMAQATGQSTIELTAYSETEFRYDPASLSIIFEPKGNGVDYNTFTLEQGGRQFKFTKE